MIVFVIRCANGNVCWSVHRGRGRVRARARVAVCCAGAALDEPSAYSCTRTPEMGVSSGWRCPAVM